MDLERSESQFAPLFLVAVAAVLVLYVDTFGWLVSVWSQSAEYSHGFLVALFSVYLLWSNRNRVRSVCHPSGWELLVSVSLVVAGLALRLLGIYLRAVTLEAVSILPFLLGVAGIAFGAKGIKWALAATLFLLFMIPLPRFLAGQLGGFLQLVATTVSTYSLQTFGIPAFAEGNVIRLSNSEIGVAEACSGLRMLNAFFALTVGACLIIDRTSTEKFLIAVSAVPIAIAANCIRIVTTGVICEWASPETAQFIFHDIAGWLMVPLGFCLLAIELALLDRLIEPEESLPVVLQ